MLLKRFAREIASGTLAGAAAGVLVFGIGGRIAMRVSGALADERLRGVMTSERGFVGAVTWGGSLQVVVLGAIVGIMGAAFYIALRPALPERHRGLVLGFVSLLVSGGSAVDAGNSDFRMFGIPFLNILLFAALPLLWGVIVVRWDDAIRTRLPTSRLAWPLYGALAFLLVALGIMGPFLMAEDHPLVAMAIGALVVLAALAHIPRLRPWTRPALVIPCAIGLVGIGVSVAGIV